MEVVEGPCGAFCARDAGDQDRREEGAVVDVEVGVGGIWEELEGVVGEVFPGGGEGCEEQEDKGNQGGHCGRISRLWCGWGGSCDISFVGEGWVLPGD